MLSPDFLCVCGHRNKAHTSLEDALKYRSHIGRMCIEFADTIYIKGKAYHSGESLCSCNDFSGDNLRYLETASEKVV